MIIPRIQTQSKVKQTQRKVKQSKVKPALLPDRAIPHTWSLKRKNSAYGDNCTKKPDADNIGKVICDALNGTAYKDDACVTELDVAKRYCGKGEQSRVEVTVAMYVDDDGCGTTRPDHVREIGQ